MINSAVIFVSHSINIREKNYNYMKQHNVELKKLGREGRVDTM